MPDTTKNGNIIKVSAAEQRLRDRETALQTVRDRLLACIPANLEETIRQANELLAIDKQCQAVEDTRNKTRQRARGMAKVINEANRQKEARRQKRIAKSRPALGETDPLAMAA